MTLTKTAIVFALLIAAATDTWANPLAIAKALDDRVTNAVKQCKPQDLVDLYEKNAIAIYSGEGEIGRKQDRDRTIGEELLCGVLS